MGLNWAGMVAAAVVILPTAGVAQTVDTTGHTALVVRTFNRSGLSLDEVRTGEAGARLILEGAGIEVSWVDCWNGDKEPDSVSPICRRPLGGNDAILRFQPADATPGHALVSMGFSLVNSRDDVPHLSTIYTDQVTNVARRAGVDARVLLGRAIAHELGHLLLNSNQHAKAGLMREVWSQSELRHDRTADWSFQENEARIMRAALTHRLTLDAPRLTSND